MIPHQFASEGLIKGCAACVKVRRDIEILRWGSACAAHKFDARPWRATLGTYVRRATELAAQRDQGTRPAIADSIRRFRTDILIAIAEGHPEPEALTRIVLELEGHGKFERRAPGDERYWKLVPVEDGFGTLDSIWLVPIEDAGKFETAMRSWKAYGLRLSVFPVEGVDDFRCQPHHPTVFVPDAVQVTHASELFFCNPIIRETDDV